MNQQHATLTKTTAHASITSHLQLVLVWSVYNQPDSWTEKSTETISSRGSTQVVAKQKIFFPSLSLSIQKKKKKKELVKTEW